VGDDGFAADMGDDGFAGDLRRIEASLGAAPAQGATPTASLRELCDLLPAAAGQELRRAVADLADESERLADAIGRLGTADLPNATSIDSAQDFTAIQGYSDARSIVAALPGAFREATSQSTRLLRELRRQRRRQRAEFVVARRDADEQVVALIQSAMKAYESVTDKRIAEPGLHTAERVSTIHRTTWDVRERFDAQVEEVVEVLLPYLIGTSVRYRLRLWWGRTAVRSVQAAIVLFGFVGVEVVLVNFLSGLVGEWWLSTGVSTVAALGAAALVGWITNRYLGSSKSRHVRRVAGGYVRARIALIAAQASRSQLADVYR
jgi:hypothetical protein